MSKRKSFKEKLTALRGKRKRFGVEDSGSAAVEFSIVAPIFLALMFSVFEVGWFFYTNSVLDAATDMAGRLVRTGQIQESTTLTTPQQQYDFLYDEICDIVDAWGDCSLRLTMEMQTFTSFAALAAATTPMTCADSPPNEVAAIPFQLGLELQIVRVRVCLIYDTINPAIGANLAEGAQGQRHLISTMIFQNEPYEQG
jgi:Flp pilus assembly protein TadG